jgi:hypothetical protein
MKKIIFVALTCLYSFGAHSQVRTFDIKMTPCLIGSNCSKCAEIISIKYEVDYENKVVTVSGVAIKGELVREFLNDCLIKDQLNWMCRQPTITVSAKDNLISVITNKNSSLYASQKEMCIVK